jgi:hypothetical protein
MFNKKIRKELKDLRGWIISLQSKLDKNNNKIQSNLDKQINKVKESQPKANTELQDNLIEALLVKNKMFVYELDNTEKKGSFLGFDLYVTDFITRKTPALLFRTITIEDLQKLESYTTFKADGKTYIITNKELK